MRRTWVVAVVAVGIVLGVAIAGIPNRHHDAPLKITATTTIVGPISPTTTTIPTTATTPPTTTTP